MNALARWIAGASRWLVHARWLTLALALWLAASGTALAQGRKKKEEAAPTKSYVGAYFIVMMGLGLGLFAALRPSARIEEVQKKIKDDDDE